MEPTDNSAHRMVVQPTAVQLLDDEGQGRLVQAEFRYQESDPYAVSISLDEDAASAVWTFARDLLSEGLSGPTGDGDVHVWPGCTVSGHTVVLIEVTSDDEDVILAALPEDVSSFLASTTALVAVGDESLFLDVDAAIAAILTRTATGQVDE